MPQNTVIMGIWLGMNLSTYENINLKDYTVLVEEVHSILLSISMLLITSTMKKISTWDIKYLRSLLTPVWDWLCSGSFRRLLYSVLGLVTCWESSGKLNFTILASRTPRPKQWVATRPCTSSTRNQNSDRIQYNISTLSKNI